jgi:hypothetical protein
MARHLAPVGAPVFRVLETITSETAEGASRKTFAYGPYMTKGAAKRQRNRLEREHRDYRKVGRQELRLQTSPDVWTDVVE